MIYLYINRKRLKEIIYNLIVTMSAKAKQTNSKKTDDIIDDDNIWEIFDDIIDERRDEKSDETPNKKSKCESCKSDNLLVDNAKGYTVCKDCGVIDYNGFDNGLDKNNYDDDKDISRYGCPTNFFLPKSSIGTSIGGVGNYRMKMLQKWSQMPYKERSLYEVMQNIDTKCKKYNITKSVIDNAKILYKHISELKYDSNDKNKTIIIRGVNRISLIAACVFYGAKLQKFPRSPKEIAEIFDLKLTQVTKGCRKFLELMEKNPIIVNMKTSNATDFIERYSNKLKLKKEYIDQAIKIVNNINRLDLISDHQPPSIAAGSLMMMSNVNNLDLSKKTISEIFGISEVTIAKTYNRIAKYQNILINDDLVNDVLNKIQPSESSNKNKVNTNNIMDKSIFNTDGL